MTKQWQLWVAGNETNVASSLDSMTRMIAAGHSCHVNALCRIGDIASRLSELPAEDLRNSLVIVDIMPIDNAFYVSTMGVAIELLLSFPEVTWVFVGTKPTPVTDVESLRELLPAVYVADGWALKGLSYRLDQHEAGLRSLFDPFGLRQVIKKAAHQMDAERFRDSPAPTADERRASRRAVTIDEELAFAYLAGYTVFRGGYSCHVATSLRGMRELVGTESLENFDLAIDDIQLSFADDNPATRSLFGKLNSEEFDSLDVALGHSSDLRKILDARDKRWFPGLEKAKQRLHLTRLPGEDLEIVEKPFPGIHYLLERVARIEKAGAGEAEEKREPTPQPSLSQAGATALSRHAAPSSLQLTIQLLLERCRKIWRDGAGQGCEHFVHGALLAFEAGELLNRRAQTTGLEILELRHCFEVQAECMFHGISAPVRIAPRLKEVKQEIQSTLCLDGPPREPWQRKQFWSAYLRILHQFKSIFAASGQFEEESYCLKKLRQAIRNDRYWGLRTQVHNRKARGENGWKNLPKVPIAWLRRAASWYFSMGVSSVPSAVALLLFWALVFGILLYELHPMPHPGGLALALESSAISLTTLGPVLVCGCPLTPQLAAILLPAMIVAYIHLGLLISLAYQWVSRR
ncbi:MAG: hypothetical protein QOF89_333 [Acidobacteriota bacterium]|jgi:hypothetical protein|nr:hypothetical protein [Acidobacteriota bacterium]